MIEESFSLIFFLYQVVTRNQKFCMEQNGESLNSLAVLMMHCEIIPEESQLAKCTPEMVSLYDL